MNFTSNFLRILLLIVFTLFSCAHIFADVSSDSKLGNCSDYDLRRSPLLVREIVHKPNNYLNKLFPEFGQLNWTIRFPEVITQT